MTEIQAQSSFAEQFSLLQRALQRTTLSEPRKYWQPEMEVLQEAPKTSTFVPLSEHQSATPASFYSGPPILHYHSDRCKILILERDLSLSPALHSLAREAKPASSTNGNEVNGDKEHTNDDEVEESRKVLEDVAAWVTSEYVSLYITVVFADILASENFSCFPQTPLLVSQYHTLPYRCTRSNRYLFQRLASSRECTCS